MGAALFLGNKVAQLNYSIPEIEKKFQILKNNKKKLFDYEFFLVSILIIIFVYIIHIKLFKA